jgi:hypothetical protein
LAVWELAHLLAERGDVDGLREWVDVGDHMAAEKLVGLLTERGDLDALRSGADAGDRRAASRLARSLAEHRDLDELQARSDTGNDDLATGLLVRLLLSWATSMPCACSLTLPQGRPAGATLPAILQGFNGAQEGCAPRQ